MFTYEELRPWQKRYYNELILYREKTFLCVALPGSGKTIPTLLFAKRWLDENPTRMTVIVVPTRNVRRQWKKVAHSKFEIQLYTREFDGDVKAGTRGVVVTYSTIATSAQSFRKLCEKYEVLVVFDEFHHAGESQTWGIAVLEAFDPAIMRIALSGTPWRSDGGVIPFLKRDEKDEYIKNYYHDWPRALEEEPRAIRELSFKGFHGDVTIEECDSGETRILSSKFLMTRDDEAKCLRGRVTDSKWYGDVLTKANECLSECRKHIPDAAGIVVCVDITHAEKVAEDLAEIVGEDPILVTSDDNNSEDLIAKFEKSKNKWIVSVRQVSEGADIPRLMVGVYLTNYTTELYFRQFVGRVIRHRGNEHDKEAYIFYPHQKELTSYAEEIQRMQIIAIKRKQDKEPGEPLGPNLPGGGSIIIDVSSAEFAGTILPMLGKSYGPDRSAAIKNFCVEFDVNENTAARIMEAHGMLEKEEEPIEIDEKPDEDLPLEDRMMARRTRQNKRIGYWANLTGRAHEELQKEANSAVNITSVKNSDVTEDKLKQRGIYIEQKIKEARQQNIR